MEQLLKVLLVEDNPGDMVLLKGVLLRATPQAEYLLSHEPTLRGALERLRQEPFDVVLLDLSLPDSTGMDTVRSMLEHSQDLPIIVLTGNDDGAVGNEAVQLGVQDYLIKGTIDRPMLARAISYARQRKHLEAELRKANLTLEERVKERTAELERTVTLLGEEILQHQQSQGQLNEATGRFMAMIDALPDVFWMISADSSHVYCNLAYEKLWGKSRKELVERPTGWMDTIHPDDRARMKRDVSAWMTKARNGEVRQAESHFRIVRGDGSIAEIRCRVFTMVGRDGRLEYICGLAEDVSAQLQATPTAAPTAQPYKLDTPQPKRKSLVRSFREIFSR